MSEIIVKGKNARERVLAALTKEFPTARVERRPSEFEILKAVNTAMTKEKNVRQDLLVKALDSQLTLLESEIDGLLGKKSKNAGDVEDDWSAAADDNADDNDDDQYDNDDDGEDDNEDDDFDKIAKQTKFEAMANKIANDEGVSKDKAMTLARQRFPDLYRGFQGIEDTQKSYRALVGREIAKGCSETVARQRVAYAHPHAAREQIEKGVTANSDVAAFMAKVDAAMQTYGVSRTEGMQIVRRSRPDLFAKFRNV